MPYAIYLCSLKQFAIEFLIHPKVFFLLIVNWTCQHTWPYLMSVYLAQCWNLTQLMIQVISYWNPLNCCSYYKNYSLWCHHCFHYLLLKRKSRARYRYLHTSIFTHLCIVCECFIVIYFSRYIRLPKTGKWQFR